MDRVPAVPSKYKSLSHYINKVTYSQHVNKGGTLKIPLNYFGKNSTVRLMNDSVIEV